MYPLLLLLVCGFGVIAASATASGTRTATTIRELQNVAGETGGCQNHDVDFIMIEGDADLLAVEDNIREHLEAVGFNVNTRLLSKEDFNAAHQSGDFHLSFTETWGAPYDPHSYAMGWLAGDEGHQQAMTNLESPISRELLFSRIEDVLKEVDHRQREVMWKDIHTALHQQAIMLPLWGKRIPTVLNNRLVGYEPGLQQFDYPVHRLQVLSGSKTVTIAPGAQTGLFESVGRLDPHSYRPNEFFANNWVYEGLVSYGPRGQVLPALAEAWSVESDGNGGQAYTFALRPNVTFHDGTPWDCDAAKLNFDHCLAEPLRSPDWHGWYGLPKEVSSWSCKSSGEFVVETKSSYYPLLQELSFIRPLRMLSPASFVPGADPLTANSCPAGWGQITSGQTTVNCAGILNISGTGPFAFDSRTSVEVDGETVDQEVVFVSNDNYWGGAPSIERLLVVRYESPQDVKAALMDRSLDAVWGAGVLQAQDLIELDNDDDSTLSVFHTGDIQNVLLLLNSGKPPLDDVNVRKTLIHAIDKASIVKLELGEDTRPVDNIFPLDAPYCDVDLTPRWDYDLQKAILLNCNINSGNINDEGGTNKALAVGLGVGLGIVVLVLAFGLHYFFARSKKFQQELEALKKNEDGIDA